LDKRLQHLGTAAIVALLLCVPFLLAAAMDHFALAAGHAIESAAWIVGFSTGVLCLPWVVAFFPMLANVEPSAHETAMVVNFAGAFLGFFINSWIALRWWSARKLKISAAIVAAIQSILVCLWA
jgi:hypothetical protein